MLNAETGQDLWKRTESLMVKFQRAEGEISLDRSYTHTFFQIQPYGSMLKDMSSITAVFMT